MNIFSAITSWLQWYDAFKWLTETPQAQALWSAIWQSKLGQQVSPIAQNIQSNVFSPIKKATAPIVDTFYSATAKPVVKEYQFQKATNDYYKPYREEIQKLGITQDDLNELPEEEKKQIMSQLQSIWVDLSGWEAEKPIQSIQQKESFYDKYKMKSSENFWVVEWAKDIGKFFVNLPADSAEVVWGLYDMITNPIDTVSWLSKWVGTIVWGNVDKAVYSIANWISSYFWWPQAWPSENSQMVDAIAKNIKDQYWTAWKLKKAIVENPADTLLTLMWWLWVASNVAKSKWFIDIANKIDKVQKVVNPVNILKKEAELATYPIRKIVPEVLWKTTWTSAETIRTAFKQWGTKEFQSALRWETTPQDILASTKEWLQAIKDNRGLIYGKDYEKIKANKTPIIIDDVKESFIKSLKDEYKIWVSKKWLDFSQSKITGGTSQSQIENMYKDLLWWKDNTPEGLDILKQRLQDYYRWTPDSSKWDRLSTIASNAVKNKIVSSVPEYATMTANYEKLTNDIRDITKTLSLWDKVQSQTALTKLNSVLRDNFQARQDMIKLIEQYSGKNLQGQIAGASLNPSLAKWLAWVITGWGIVFWQLANPAFWWWLAVASPRLIWEIANTVWIPIEKFKSAINNFKNGNTTFNTARNTVEWITKKLNK